MSRERAMNKRGKNEMPIPILFIGIAAATGMTGLGKTVKAGFDQHKANVLNDNSNARIEAAAQRLDTIRRQCGTALEELGREKMFVLNQSMHQFLESFSRIKNVDFTDSAGLAELKKLHIDKKEFESLAAMNKFAGSLAAGGAAGVAGGAVTALGAYGAAATFATASTGTAISTLSGAAASNATLAFFGGGSLASGGLGMAGGTAVLGGLVAGPALLVMGLITGAQAGKSLENAKINAAQTTEYCEQLETGAVQCVAIRRRTMLFYSLLAQLDSFFLPQIYELERIVKTAGTDYSLYSAEEKGIIARAAAIAVTIKSVLDTPILSENGELTKESKDLVDHVKKRLPAAS